MDIVFNALFGIMSDFDLSLDAYDVSCTGNEANLRECIHPGLGVHNCRYGKDDFEAGVICTGKCQCNNHATGLVKIEIYMQTTHVWKALFT